MGMIAFINTSSYPLPFFHPASDAPLLDVQSSDGRTGGVNSSTDEREEARVLEQGEAVVARLGLTRCVLDGVEEAASDPGDDGASRELGVEEAWCESLRHAKW